MDCVPATPSDEASCVKAVGRYCLILIGIENSFYFTLNSLFPNKSVSDRDVMRKCVTSKAEFDKEFGEKALKMGKAIVKELTDTEPVVTCQSCSTDGCNGASAQ